MERSLVNRLVQCVVQCALAKRIDRLLLLAFLATACHAARAEDPIDLGSLSAAQLVAVAADPTNHADQRPETLLWLAYRFRNDQQRGQQWQQKSKAAIANAKGVPEGYRVLNELLGCNLSQQKGLPLDPACLEMRPGVSAIVDSRFRAIGWHLLSNLYQRSGQLHQALELNQLALLEAEQINLESELSEFHNSRGVGYLDLGLPLQSLKHFELAHQHLGSTNNSTIHRVLALNIGVSQLRAELFGEAKQTFITALPWISESGGTTWMTAALTFLAEAEIGLGEPQAAIDRLQPHIEAHKHEIDSNSLLSAQAALAEALIAKGQHAQALEKLTTTIAQAMQANNQARTNQLRLLQARAYNLAENHAAALETLQVLGANLTAEPGSQTRYQALRISASSHAAQGNYAAAFADQAEAQRVERVSESGNFKNQLSLLTAKLDRDKNAHELMLSQQRERELYIQTRLSQTILVGSLVLGSLLVFIVYLLLSRLFQKRLADRERDASLRLEAQVDERTQALESTMAAQLNVEEDRRLLQQSLFEGEKLRALGQLTGGVAHDFNNLMTVVTLSAELLRDELTSQQQRAQQSVSDILRAAQSAADITSGLLAYARKQPLKPERVELQEFANELLPLFQRSLDENISLRITAPERCQVIVDPSQLTTCLLNLLLNAKEALTEGGAIAITVEAAPPEQGDFVRICVTDNGRGMGAAELKSATDPFFTTKETNQGSGLGLSMVYGFVKQSGGDLQITSTENLGTEITITLPTVDSASQTQPEIQVAEPGVLPEHAKVLVVEDQKEVRDVLQRLLESLGLEVSIAVSGDAGKRRLIEIGEPDLLITDIVMPGDTSGHALATFAQQLYPDLAVLIISGYSESHDGDWPFLHKPFSLSELRAKVTSLLAPKQPVGPKPVVHPLPSRASA